MPVIDVEEWLAANRDMFEPPICNKLMHTDQLNVMFVGGPNTRKDFHVELGDEFFFMVRGDMSLPIRDKYGLRTVHIREGEVFLLPARIPHSPQRPQQQSRGLVIERQRRPGEKDCLRWYNEEGAIYEEWFQLDDLEKLKFIVQDFFQSPQCAENRASSDPNAKGRVLPPAEAPFVDNREISVPEPFALADFVKQQRDLSLPVEVFPDHPAQQTEVWVCTSGDFIAVPAQTWVWQLAGTSQVTQNDETITLRAGGSLMVPENQSFRVSADASDTSDVDKFGHACVTLVVRMVPSPLP
ncbi:MAG: hypothetical protein MHM6MM_008803 [Cercozoa sp. M6MM]